jgi:hypothetical protein
MQIGTQLTNPRGDYLRTIVNLNRLVTLIVIAELANLPQIQHNMDSRSTRRYD